MSGVTLNDVVVEWGSHNGANAYNPAKDRLTAGMSQDEVAAFAGATNWNDGLRYLAQGPPVLQEAVLLLDASFSDAGEPRVINRGTGGSALNAKYGSVLGAYVYDGAAVLPGINANQLSTPDLAAYSPTSTLDVRAIVSATDWSPSGQQVVVGQYNTATANRSWLLGIDTTGGLVLIISADGVSGFNSPSTVAASVADGGELAIRGVWSASVPSVTYYTKPAVDHADLLSDDGWTQLGDAKTAGCPASVFAATATLSIGELSSAGLPLNGSVRSVSVEVDGTSVFELDGASDIPDYATSFTATTGQTVTVNSTSSDTNDPLLLTHTGESYVRLPGLTGNYLSVPDSVALSLTDNLFVYAEVAMDDWTPSTGCNLISKWTAAGNQRSWRMQVGGTGFISFNISTLGTDQVGLVSTASITASGTVSDGGRIFVGATYVGDDGAGNKMARFWTSPDGVDWTELGSPRVEAGTAAIFDSTAVVELGSINTGSAELAALKMYRAGINSGIDVSGVPGGTAVFEFESATDITDAGATSFTATSGQTVTVNRATSGRKTALVTRPIWLFGTDDFLEVADNALLDFALADSFTVVAVVRNHGTFLPENNHIVSKRVDAATVGWTLIGFKTGTTTALNIHDGTNQVTATAPAISSGQATTLVGVRNTTADTVAAYKNETAGTPLTDTSTATLANSYPLRIGTSPTGTFYHCNMEILAVAVFRRVLTTDEIAAINTYYGTA